MTMVSDLSTLKKTVSLDVTQLRQDFPILDQKINGHPLVYLDNAATTQKPACVIEAVSDYYEKNNANIHRGVHTLSERATYDFEQARETVQHFINAPAKENIVFVRGTTEAINLVATSYGQRFVKAGDEILISEMEHHSNIIPWQLLCERVGAVLKVIPINDQGELKLDSLDTLLNKKTKMVAVTYISNALGTINPIKQIIDKAHAMGAPVLIDAAQAAPHQVIDVQALDCDFLAISSHKVFGPTGIGALYGKTEWLEKLPPYQGGGEMIKKVSFTETIYNDVPFKFEAGTMNIAGAIGFARALHYVQSIGLENIKNYELALLKYATEVLSKIPNLQIIGQAKTKAPVISFLLAGIHPHDIGSLLDAEGVAVRTGHHCAQPVMSHFKVPATTRASFAFYNTFEEIDALVAGLLKIQTLFQS